MEATATFFKGILAGEVWDFLAEGLINAAGSTYSR